MYKSYIALIIIKAIKKKGCSVRSSGPIILTKQDNYFVLKKDIWLSGTDSVNTILGDSSQTQFVFKRESQVSCSRPPKNK